jgi:hypothetical protein
MANIINATAQWAGETGAQTHQSIWSKWLAFSDTQAKNQTMWFLFSLILQGVFFLPIPAALIFYYNAPITVLVVTLALYFANIIAGMGGSGIRLTLLFFAISVIIHLFIVAVFIL